jgi:hypothetical protein
MVRIAVLAVVVMVLLGIASRADARVRCSSGTTAFVEGTLRIFGTHFDRPDPFGGREFGFDEYACLGGRRPAPFPGRGGRRPAPADRGRSLAAAAHR